MPYDQQLKEQAEKLLQAAIWKCNECGGDMPLEYEENDEDEVGYTILSAICDDCGMINDSTINNEIGRKIDECSTKELLGM